MTTNPSLKRPLTLLKSVYGSHPSNSSELKNCFYTLKSETFKTTINFVKLVIGAYYRNIIIIIQFQSFWILDFFHGRPNVLHEDFTMNKYVEYIYLEMFSSIFWHIFVKMFLKNVSFVSACMWQCFDYFSTTADYFNICSGYVTKNRFFKYW